MKQLDSSEDNRLTLHDCTCMLHDIVFIQYTQPGRCIPKNAHQTKSIMLFGNRLHDPATLILNPELMHC